MVKSEPEKKNSEMAETVDYQALQSLVDAIGLDTMSSVFELFVIDAAEKVQLIQQHVQEDSALGLRESAHSLKSASANLAMTELATLAAELEALALGSEEMVERTHQLSNKLPEALQQATSDMQHWLTTQAS